MRPFTDRPNNGYRVLRNSISCLLGEGYGCGIDLTHFVAQTPWLQHMSRRRKRVGDDDFSTGLDESLVHLAHDLGMRHDGAGAPDFSIHWYPGLFQFGPHAAIDNNGQPIAAQSFLNPTHFTCHRDPNGSVLCFLTWLFGVARID